MTTLTDTFDLLDDDGPETYRALLAAASTSGRCPVWVTATAAECAARLTAAERAARLLDVARADPAALLERNWKGPCPSGCCPAPLPPWPGLLAAEPVPEDLLVGAAERWARARYRPSHLAVVDAARPADVPAVVGWLGAANYSVPATELSTVLRSWEDRFGAVLVEMEAATLRLAVALPPRTHADALRVAAEHFAFCPDQQDPQDGHTWYGLEDYAAKILHERTWRFWWD